MRPWCTFFLVTVLKSPTFSSQVVLIVPCNYRRVFSAPHPPSGVNRKSPRMLHSLGYVSKLSPVSPNETSCRGTTGYAIHGRYCLMHDTGIGIEPQHMSQGFHPPRPPFRRLPPPARYIHALGLGSYRGGGDPTGNSRAED